MGKVIGIDLGTTFSVVAIMEGKEPKVITNEEGSRTTPSVVAFGKDGEIMVGQVARRQAITNPENTLFSVKRLIGRKYEESLDDAKRLPFKVVKASNGDAHIDVRGKTYSPPEISAKVLQKLKKAAENYLGEEVKDAVITVPAYFNDSQRQATKDAGKIAGLNVLRIVNEPTAAALAYGMDRKKDEKIAVFDFGGGTFDISVLEVGENVVEVIATNGDTHLGGDDIDQIIMQYLIDEFKKDQGIDVSRDKMVLQRLREAAEKAKIELSSTIQTEINLPFLTADASGPKHMQMTLTRAKLEAMCSEIFERLFNPTKKCLADSKLKPSDIDEVVLVGGSTRIPKVQQMVKEFFGKEPNRSVNPDEVVALGAAVQAGVLSGEVKDLLLLDVTPLSLGIETLGGVMTVLITRNTTIPTKKTEVFSTASDNQTSVEVHVLQGEREMARDNRTLGRFHLDGIPPAPRGVPQIEVTFDIDANGILHVNAKDRATGRDQHITITASSGLSKEEIDRKVREAKEKESEDKKRRELVEERNKLDGLIYSTEKTLKDNGAKLSADAKKPVEDALGEVKKKLNSEDAAEIRAAFEQLMNASHRMAEEMYRSAGGGTAEAGTEQGAGAAADSGGSSAAGSANSGKEGGKKEPGVVDAEFEEQ